MSNKKLSAKEFFPDWWKERQEARPEPMRKPFGNYMNDKWDFAESYANYLYKAKINDNSRST